MRDRAAQDAMHVLARDVAAHLPGWEAVYDDSEHWNPRGRIVDADGRHIDLYLESGTKTKLTCNASLPDGERPYGVSWPSIGCSLGRGAEAIAADIARRLIPEQAELWRKVLDYQAVEDREFRARLRTARQIARVGGAQPPQVEGRQDNKAVRVYPQGRGRWVVRTYEGRTQVDAEFHGLPGALAVQIAELVAEHERRHSRVDSVGRR